MLAPRPPLPRIGALLAMLAIAACTPGAADSGDEPADESAAVPEVTVTVPPVRLTPFCQAMIDLADELENDPPEDIEAAILETYEDIVADVPDAIREDFAAVLAELRGDAAPTIAIEPAAPVTTIDSGPPVTDETGAIVPEGDPFADEGRGPDDDPAARVNTYVDFECRNVENNPGPPATQPLSAPPTSEPEAG